MDALFDIEASIVQRRLPIRARATRARMMPLAGFSPAKRGIDPDAIRPSLPPALRQAVIDRDGMICGLCRGDVEDIADIHIDHVKPRVHGGSDHISNLQVAHSWCNLSKGARL